MNKTFRETQGFNKLIIGLLIAFVFGGTIYGYYHSNQLENGDMTQSYWATGISLLVAIWLLSVRLRTEIDHEGIHMKFRPFANKHLAWSDIESIEVVNYGFVGGWGVRLFTKYGTVYNTKGQWGIAIVPKEGKKFLIGTQRPEEVKMIIQHYLSR